MLISEQHSFYFELKQGQPKVKVVFIIKAWVQWRVCGVHPEAGSYRVQRSCQHLTPVIMNVSITSINIHYVFEQ